MLSTTSTSTALQTCGSRVQVIPAGGNDRTGIKQKISSHITENWVCRCSFHSTFCNRFNCIHSLAVFPFDEIELHSLQQHRLAIFASTRCNCAASLYLLPLFAFAPTLCICSHSLHFYPLVTLREAKGIVLARVCVCVRVRVCVCVCLCVWLYVCQQNNSRTNEQICMKLYIGNH